MQRVVDDLLLLAGISHPQHPLELARVGIADAIGDFLESSPAEAKGVSLQVRVAEPGLDRRPRHRDRPVLSNLVSNAIKYTRRGGKTCGCAPLATSTW